MKPEGHILHFIKRLPAGQKVPIGPLSRRINATQAVTIDMLARLVEQGVLDRETLRLVPPKPRQRPQDLLPPAEIVREIHAFLAEHPMAPTRFGKLCCGDFNLLGRFEVSKGVRRSTVEKIRTFMADFGRAEPEPVEEPETVEQPPAPLPSQAWPEDFQAKLDRVARGEVGIGPAFHPRRADPEGTLGGIATGML